MRKSGSMLEKNREYKFYEVINELKEKYLKIGEKELYKDNNWCVYAKHGDIYLDSDCYVDEYPEIDDDTYEETLPEFVYKNELELVFRDELLQDVVISALKRKENASNEELMEAVNYYNNNDCFLEL